MIGHESRSRVEIDTVVRNFHRKRSNLCRRTDVYEAPFYYIQPYLLGREYVYSTSEKYVVRFLYTLGSFFYKSWRIIVERI